MSLPLRSIAKLPHGHPSGQLLRSLRSLRLFGLAWMLSAAFAASAQVTVSGAWVRGTVAQQKATGAFMQISAVQGGKLLAVTSPAAGVAEIHEMRMDGSTMQMRALPDGLPLPAGQPVSLKPGSFHLMLMDLKAPLKAGDQVELKLTIETTGGKRETLTVKAPVKALGASDGALAGKPGAAHKH